MNNKCKIENMPMKQKVIRLMNRIPIIKLTPQVFYFIYLTKLTSNIQLCYKEERGGNEMRNFRKLFSLLLVMLFSFSIPVIADTTTTTLSDMKIHYIDVGQGDSELIQVDGKNILIDAGTSDNKSLNYLKSIGVTTLDYVIATHPHEDHIGAMDDVINTFNIGTFYAPQTTTTTKTFENMINSLKAKNLKITVPKAGDTLTIRNATLTFLAPNATNYEDLNNYSIVVKLKYGNNSFIFMGDAESVSEGEILAKQLDISANVLKVGHHGSLSSTTLAFLNKVNPQYAVISVGTGNEYGHPAGDTLNKLNAKGIKTFRTDLNGTIILTSNGQSITFNTSPIAAGTVAQGTTTFITPVVPVHIQQAPIITNVNNKSQTVWIANSNSKIYHDDKECSNMKSPIAITLQEAQQRGLKPCEKCVN